MQRAPGKRRRVLELTMLASLACSCTRGNEGAQPDTTTAPAPKAALRAPDVPYEPSPEHVVTEIIRLARLAPGDVLYDLGCGDGRIVIAAVRSPGVRGTCVDIDPQRITESRANARRAGVSDRIEFLTQDLFETDLRRASVVTLFLWPKISKTTRRSDRARGTPKPERRESADDDPSLGARREGRDGASAAARALRSRG